MASVTCADSARRCLPPPPLQHMILCAHDRGPPRRRQHALGCLPSGAAPPMAAARRRRRPREQDGRCAGEAGRCRDRCALSAAAITLLRREICRRGAAKEGRAVDGNDGSSERPDYFGAASGAARCRLRGTLSAGRHSQHFPARAMPMTPRRGCASDFSTRMLPAMLAQIRAHYADDAAERAVTAYGAVSILILARFLGRTPRCAAGSAHGIKTRFRRRHTQKRCRMTILIHE